MGERDLQRVGSGLCTTGIFTLIGIVGNSVQPPLDSDKASTDFGEPANDRRSSWPSQPQTSSNANSRPHVIPALGLELHSTTTSTVRAPATAAPNGIEASTRRPTTSTTPPDLSVFKANVGIAEAKIEVAKAQVKQELAKRKLLELQIAVRAIRRRLRNESTRVAEVAKEEVKEEEQPVEEHEGDSRYADAQVQTEEEVREIREKAKVPADELDEEDDELLVSPNRTLQYKGGMIYVRSYSSSQTRTSPWRKRKFVWLKQRSFGKKRS